MKIKKAIKAALFSIISNAALALIKGVAGVLGNSSALIADATESLADTFSSILVLVGIKLSAKPPDENHPYGHGRFDTLSSFAVIFFLLVSATLIGYGSISDILAGRTKTPETFTLFILAGIIGFKEIAFRYVMKKGIEANSPSLQADAWHHRADMITSLMAFIGISIAIFLDWEAADDWAALIAALIIAYNAFKIFRPVLGEIAGEQLYGDLEQKVREIAAGVPEVRGTEKCRIQKMGTAYYVDLHMKVDGNISVKEGHDIAHKLKDEIMRQIPSVGDVLVHTEPDGFGMHGV